MTLFDIVVYLREHSYLLFFYKTKCYSLQQVKSGFKVSFRLKYTDNSTQEAYSLDVLMMQAVMHDGKLLYEAIDRIALPHYDDCIWTSFEAIQHVVAVYNHEIHFCYKGTSYWILRATDGTMELCNDYGEEQKYENVNQLFVHGHIHGNKLSDIWCDVCVDAY